MLKGPVFREELDNFKSMRPGCLLLSLFFLSGRSAAVSAQQADSLFMLSGVVYDEDYNPVGACHVINRNTRAGTITDTLGIFRIPAHLSDTLLIRNIAFLDTLVTASILKSTGHIRIRKRYYALEEAMVFPWGSTYDDFTEAITNMPDVRSPGESLGLPRQDPGYVPREMDESYVKSPGFLITSPVSYFYQNFSRHAKSERRVFWLRKNNDRQAHFDAIFSGENISSISGYSGSRLEAFLVFLNDRMNCDYRCSELEIYTEIHRLLDEFTAMQGEGEPGN